MQPEFDLIVRINQKQGALLHPKATLLHHMLKVFYRAPGVADGQQFPHRFIGLSGLIE